MRTTVKSERVTNQGIIEYFMLWSLIYFTPAAFSCAVVMSLIKHLWVQMKILGSSFIVTSPNFNVHNQTLTVFLHAAINISGVYHFR